MRRKRRDETVEPFRQRVVREAGAPIRTELKAWAARGASDLLQTMRPVPIGSLSDRQNDISEPLLAIAQLAGDGWLQRLTVALESLFKAGKVEDGSVGSTLLFDIRTAFDERKGDAVPSATLAASSAISKAAHGLTGTAKECRPTTWRGNSRNSASIHSRSGLGIGLRKATVARTLRMHGLGIVRSPRSRAPQRHNPRLHWPKGYLSRNTPGTLAAIRNPSNLHEQRVVAAVALYP